MKNIVESILQINEGHNSWQVTNSLDRPHSIARFNAPNDAYMWVYESGGMIGFLSLDKIESNFKDFGMEDEFNSISKLKPGESWCEDGENIYIRLH